jgi:hypothetical protein
MVNTRNNQCNGQANNSQANNANKANNNPRMEQLIATFSQAKDPMEAKDWLKSIKKKLEIAQCTDQKKVLFVAHQLFGTIAGWWETYRNSH